MICWAEGCATPGQERLVTKVVGVAGTTMKLGATRYVFCDAHWALIVERLRAEEP